MSINDDILLLKLIQSGNEQAFKYLFDTYFASLCRFAHVYVSDTQDAEELILELFVHIWYLQPIITQYFASNKSEIWP